MKNKKLNVIKEQWQRVVKFIRENFDGHVIVPESALQGLAQAAGMTYARSKKNRIAGVLTCDGMEFLMVGLASQKQFAKEVKEEGLGGYVSPGNWFGFTPLYLVEDLARRYANYHSPKMGRGSRFWDCWDALNKYVEALP